MQFRLKSVGDFEIISLLPSSRCFISTLVVQKPPLYMGYGCIICHIFDKITLTSTHAETQQYIPGPAECVERLNK